MTFEIHIEDLKRYLHIYALKTTYYGRVYPFLNYGIIGWGGIVFFPVSSTKDYQKCVKNLSIIK